MKKPHHLLFCAAAILGTCLVAPPSPAAILVAHYEFEDPDDLGHDSSGMGNHGTPTSVNAVEGMFGGGAFFDEGRGSRFVHTGGLNGYTGKPGMTFAAWVKLDPRSTGWDGIISQDAGSCCEHRLLLSPTNFPFINLSQHSDRHLTAAPQFEPDVWMHIAMTGQDVGGGAEARVYVNGVEVSGSPQSFPIMESAARWNTYLGAGEAGNPHRLTGTLDDVRIYEGALTDEEILGLLNPSTGPRLQLQITHDAEAGDLSISWESQAGELFNLRSETDLSAPEPASWPIFGGHADIEATPPRNTLTFPIPADPTRFFVVESFPAPPETIFADDFEGGQGDWTVGSDGAAGTAWELGTPSGTGPAGAKSGANCFGTNIDADYGLDADVWLRSPAIDLTGAGEATLNYHRFTDIEEGFDFGSVSVLDAADDSVLAVIEETIDGVTVDWEEVSEAIPGEALGKVIRIEFRFQSDDIQGFAGFYVDDVAVTVP